MKFVFSIALGLVLFFLGESPLNGQDIVLNELSSCNASFQDEDSDTPDWIEIHNKGNQEQSIAGWFISDDLDELNKWEIPSISLAADSYQLFWASSKDRSSIGEARTLITQGSIWKYLIPNQSLNSQWTQVSYNDASWNDGTSGFGYGDGDDMTSVPSGTRSIFIRQKFQLEDKELVEQLVLDIDYDDAFVAYINGQEVARANINGNPPSYLQNAIVDHEAGMYLGDLPDRFLVDEDLSDLLQDGENVLTIQAHNISNNSSDMTIIPFLSAFYKGATTEGIVPPEILQLEAKIPHTNFKIASEQETIYLSDSNLEIVDSIQVVLMPSDYSYGRTSGNDWSLYGVATPGEANVGPTFVGQVSSEVVFSHQGGVSSNFSLLLTGNQSDEEIRYTLDSSEPDENSLLYTFPIFVNSTTVVRARIFKENYIPSLVDSRTYLFNISHDLPISTMVTEPDNFFDSDIGIYVLGDDYEGDFPFFGSNIWEDWERPLHVSLYNTNNDLELSINMGTKIFGAYSRAMDQRSLSVFARKQYGVSEIKANVFNTRPYDEYQSLVFRNSGNDNLGSNFRDIFLTGLMENSLLDLQAYRSTVTYLNGNYWGFFHLREKVNEHFLSAKHSIDTDNIDLIGANAELIHGSNQDYLDLVNFAEFNNFDSEEDYKFLTDRVNVENFVQYNVAQIYFDNTDWPGNNIKCWKPKNGKWRWILYDTDFGFGIWNSFSYTNNTLSFALVANGPGWPNPPWSTLLFRKFVENENFRIQFVNQFADELNSRFLPEKVCERIDTVSASISSEVLDHYNRWSGNPQQFENKRDDMLNFAKQRPFWMKEHILSVFDLPDYFSLTINNQEVERGYVQVNSLSIEDALWSGDYFENNPFKVQAIPRPGYSFSHWEGSSSSTEAELEINIKNDHLLVPIWEVESDPMIPVVINEINYNSGSERNTGDWIELHNPNNYPTAISTWILRDSDDQNVYNFPENTVLQPHGFLVIASDLKKFKSVYPDIENVIGDLGFGLSSDGDAVRLFDEEENQLDIVVYENDLPWSPEANGQGATLELIKPTLDNILAASWDNVHEYGSPGVTNELPTAVQDVLLEVESSCYPNPFTNKVQLEFILPIATDVKIKIYDLRGSLVHEFTDERYLSGHHLIYSDLSFLTNGVYILKIQAKGAEETNLKLVKM